jgi:hypothetical protein
MDFSNLVMYGFCCPDYRSAAKEAKALAIYFKEEVSVRRVDDEWVIDVSERVEKEVYAQFNREVARITAEITAESAAEDAYYASTGNEEPDADPYQKEADELRRELQDDADDYARSDEEGWMYPD